MDSHALPQNTPAAGSAEPLLDIRGLKTHFRTDDGWIHAVDGVDIRDDTGATLVSLPLSVRDGTFEYPLPHKLREDGRVLELTAVKDVAGAIPNATPVASPAENYAAQNNFASSFGLATAVGSFIGMGIGAVIGLIVGTFVLPGVGTLSGLVTGASVGGIVGTIVVGGPTLIIAGFELSNTLNAPPGTTQWATK